MRPQKGYLDAIIYLYGIIFIEISNVIAIYKGSLHPPHNIFVVALEAPRMRMVPALKR